MPSPGSSSWPTCAPAAPEPTATSTRSFTRSGTPASPHVSAEDVASGSSSSSASSGARSCTAVAPPSTAAVAISPWPDRTRVSGGHDVHAERSWDPVSPSLPPPALSGSGPAGRGNGLPPLSPAVSELPGGRPQLTRPVATALPRAAPPRAPAAPSSSRWLFVLNSDVGDDLEDPEAQEDRDAPSRVRRRRARRARARNGASFVAIAPDACIHARADRAGAEVGRVVGLQPGQGRRRDLPRK